MSRGGTACPLSCWALPRDSTGRPQGSCRPTVAGKLPPAVAIGARPPPAAEQRVPMSDEPTPVAEDFRTWLSERGPDAYALVSVSEGTGADRVDAAPAPTVGESGIAGPGTDLTRLTLHKVTHGLRETLHRWLQLDGGQQQLAIVSAPSGVLCEHTPRGTGRPAQAGPGHRRCPAPRRTGRLAVSSLRRRAPGPRTRMDRRGRRLDLSHARPHRLPAALGPACEPGACRRSGRGHRGPGGQHRASEHPPPTR